MSSSWFTPKTTAGSPSTANPVAVRVLDHLGGQDGEVDAACDVGAMEQRRPRWARARVHGDRLHVGVPPHSLISRTWPRAASRGAAGGPHSTASPASPAPRPQTSRTPRCASPGRRWCATRERWRGRPRRWTRCRRRYSRCCRAGGPALWHLPSGIGFSDSSLSVVVRPDDDDLAAETRIRAGDDCEHVL